MKISGTAELAGIGLDGEAPYQTRPIKPSTAIARAPKAENPNWVPPIRAVERLPPPSSKQG